MPIFNQPFISGGFPSMNRFTDWADIDTFSVTTYITISAQTFAPQSVAVSSDGTKLYLGAGSSDQKVFQYTMSTPFTLSTASYASKLFSFSATQTSAKAMRFSPDGTKMYLVAEGKSVYQYTLSTAWDVSTASYASKSFSFASQEGIATRGFDMSPDGTKMYVIGLYDAVYQYTMSTPYDVSTASYDSKSLSVGATVVNCSGIKFSSSGLKLYLIDVTYDKVYQYNLSTAWDVSTGTYSSLYKSTYPYAHEDIDFSSDGLTMYLVEDDNERIYEYK